MIIPPPFKAFYPLRRTVINHVNPLFQVLITVGSQASRSPGHCRIALGKGREGTICAIATVLQS